MTGLTDEVKEIMSLTGFLDFFSVFESRKEGLTALS
jgi:anti-anti-sigma regulatory factor